ncbi:hypothetical protein E2C01_088173 [Portunus trituberculatus]|uniref:Uncharacterized protein n=1 Tax=Portunus trituberculatus TaxID=210409 RepID=A0A5B7JII4_PORTR|nr:hypothetical protein [Portunus trituberculatus]
MSCEGCVAVAETNLRFSVRVTITRRETPFELKHDTRNYYTTEHLTRETPFELKHNTRN